MSLWFVTPAWQRYELTAVCLEQRQRVIKDLARNSIEAHCVVIADDENLDIASAIGFETVEQNNEWLGRKFNDGMEYAAKQGAEWIVPIGSDSWIDPWYFIPLPETGKTLTSAKYAAVDSQRLGILNVGNRGAGPYVFHRSLLEPCGFRPARDEISRYVDSSTVAGIGAIDWEYRDLHALQYIGFRGRPHLTPYERLWKAWGAKELSDPWTELAKCYPASLVARVQGCL